MITAIDTNILIDIFGADPKFGRSSSKILQQCINEGKICACEITWIEVATVFPNQNLFLEQIQSLDIEFSAIMHDTALLASDIWRRYRQAGGKRTRVVADFMIGAHAIKQADRLLTRDRGFYRDYFKSLVIVNM